MDIIERCANDIAELSNNFPYGNIEHMNLNKYYKGKYKTL